MKLPDYIQKFEELRSVFDSLPDGIVAILDDDMRIATANKSISKIINKPMEELIGKKFQDLFSKRIPGIMEVINHTINKKKGVRNFTIESINEFGVPVAFLISTTIIEELSESNMSIVLTLHDISEMTRLRKLALEMQRYGEMVGKSEQMKYLYTVIESIKEYDTTVLIYGETGTGKELIARAIHNSSRRKNRPFIPVNCSALPDNLIESELFGHVKGAFTGAVSNRPGRFQLAHEGTIFLDEIGTLPEVTQIKLLRVIQEKIIEPVGSDKSVQLNVRIISATNRNLTELAAQGKFRNDLLYRLKVLPINLPPLRERKEDINLLIDHFITRLNRYYNKDIIGLSPAAKELLNNYYWPGNVRELENAIEHAFVLSTGTLIEKKHLPSEIRFSAPNGVPPLPKKNSMSELEAKIRKTLLSTHGNLNDAAGILVMHRSTLWRQMKEFKIPKGFGKLK